MRDVANTEIRRLERLHQGTELELLLLMARRELNPRQEALLRELEQRKRQLERRIAWFASLLSEDDNTAFEPADLSA